MPPKFLLSIFVCAILLNVITTPAAPNVPATDPKTQETLKSAAAILTDAEAASKQKDTTKSLSLARSAREKLQPLITDPEFADVEAWYLAGRIALLIEDDDLAAVALEAIERLDPEHADQPAQRIVVDALNARSIREKVNGLREGRAALLKLVASAQAGDVVAMTNLGFGYELGKRGLIKNEALALEWFRKGAQGGNATAMYNMGVIYETGNAGLKKNDAMAVEWYRKGAEAGDSSAMEMLALSFEHGKGGLPKDETKAIIWYQKAAAAGNGSAMATLGFMYANGKGGLEKDDALAAAWYRKGPETGNARAMAQLGSLYLYGNGSLKKDEAAALKWYQKGADAGSGMAMAGLGIIYAYGKCGLAKDEPTAVAWFRKGAEKSDETAMACLATMYAEGKGGLAQDINKARDWMKKASAAGLVTADKWLAMHPASDPRIHQTVAKAAVMVANAEKALEQHDNVKSLSLLNDARTMLQPYLREPEFSDIEAWYLAGRIALLTEDDNLATAALGAIFRLDPAYADNPDHNKTATALKTRPVLEAVERNALDRQEVLRLVARAKAGDPRAMTKLGIIYSRGQAGFVKDQMMGAAWFADAAQKGQGLAMANLGYMYETGQGVEKDEAMALDWYRKGVAAGDAYAMYNLGFVYEFGGCGLQKDETKAVTLYRDGAEAGDRMAMVRLGKMYEKGGGGLRKDDAMAVTWYLKSSVEGESAAMYELGIMHAEGRGGFKQDASVAKLWMTEAAKKGDDEARKWLVDHP